ncbi:multicopper oxidase domain-containing protein [Geobacter pickeringii]|uniref:Fibronectin type-III domain-containing protein n=1 Tax=Geobacter pickeringii TaxID=345632 RepID=A0A0B5BCA0_9BACT|nr:multicopper oxidase domain-containing protein [Geobacter pickeringii]AJE02689.1 hypothetical protein GPICK_04270 [Geobacter pickeringii]
MSMRTFFLRMLQGAAVTAVGATVALAAPTQGGTPNYFGPESNWANSPAPTVNPTTGAVSGGMRKFVDTLPGLGATAANNLGQYIPVAIPDTTTYPGSDYYEIELGQYTEKMHSDLKPTTLRGYRQTNTTDATVSKFHYLGPLIVATKDKPVRIKFTNKLPTGAGGNLFLPVDTTEMGAGMGPLGMNVSQGNPMNYTQNRGTLHLHGGRTPWISDGTPHQWTTPAGENTDYPQGVSVRNVPDMPDPGPGAITFFYSNQQSARLMFYHDHAYGITRLNVYGGEAAGYLVTDAVEQDLIKRGIIPADQIPLIIQDKSFVDPATVLATDPTWPFPVSTTLSNLWYPHVYMPNQNPNDLAGVNPVGRWDYGPWFWPVWPVTNPPITNPVTGMVYPNVPNLSMTMEAFHDTPVVNGTAYPSLTVQPKSYRFRILNAANDRFWNLQLYQASSIVRGIDLKSGGSGYTAAPVVTITPAAGDTTGKGATAQAIVDLTVGSPTYGKVIDVTLVTVGSGYTLPPVVTIAPPTAGTGATATASLYTGTTEVGMIPAIPGTANFPPEWTAQTAGQPGDILDNRMGGVPDPAMIGPTMIQIGTEGGFLPAPVTWPNIPLGYDRDPKSVTVGNVKEHNLFLGPAERADVIVDFSAYAGKTLILYNDSCAACPATDTRLDYYTADPDSTATGGTVSTLAGYGPNTRTIMQIKVATATPAPAFNQTALNAEFASTATKLGVFARSQEPIIVPQAPYNSAYDGNFPAGTTAYARIQNTSLTFQPLNLSTATPGDLVASPLTINFAPKAIAEEFENTYGRMSAFLGVEVPFTNGMNQTTIFYGYIDPATEIVNDTPNLTATPIGSAGDGTQIWKITHNGVDTHPVHFHLFDVQVINRVDWAGVVKPPEPNELGWKETVRMNPLEDIIVALRPTAPKLPFGLPDSVRPLDPTMPIGDPSGFKNVDPRGNPITPPLTNQLTNFGWEYVWHCHILSHEEMDMMRPLQFNVARTLATPPVLTVTGGGPFTLTWTDATPPNLASTLGNPANEIGFRIERANGTTGAFATVRNTLANTTSYVDTTAAPGTLYRYRVAAYNAAGDSVSNIVSAGGLTLPAVPTGLTGAISARTQITLKWRDASTNETSFAVWRRTGNGIATQIGTVTRTATDSTATGGTVTYVDGTPVAGNTYLYYVTAVNSLGASAASNTVTVNFSAPAAPTGLAGSASTIAGSTTLDRVNLAWIDNSNNETMMQVQRSTTSTFTTTVTYSLGANVTTYTQTVARPGTYFYRVRASNPVAASAWTGAIQITAP